LEDQFAVPGEAESVDFAIVGDRDLGVALKKIGGSDISRERASGLRRRRGFHATPFRRRVGMFHWQSFPRDRPFLRIDLIGRQIDFR
jgi:hypothetical protein